MNTNLLTENLKSYNPEMKPVVYPVEDLIYKKVFDTNSWFAIGHFEAEGEKLNFLYHLIIMKIKGIKMLVSCFSITNETTGWYAGVDTAYPMLRVKMDMEKFDIKTPDGYMKGDLNDMRIGAKMKNASIDMSMKALGYPLYNEGTGNFDMLGMKINQYSIPVMDTNGTITIEGKTYHVEGISWFDRQWQNDGKNFDGKWSWMDLNLDNGNRISLWDAVDVNGKVKSWATILHDDGTQTVADMVPLSECTYDYWESKKSGNYYPSRWVVKIPAVNAELEVIPAILDQEIAAMKGLAHYEGASTVKGTYNGQEVTGYCYIELVGNWSKK